jgi:predicted TPR repeat methyltransferase
MTTPDNGPPPAAGVGSSADMQADIEADIEADREAQQLNTERIGQAFSALEEGRRDAARELMEQVLDDGRVSAGGAAYVWAILQELGDAERAKMIRDGTVGTLRKVIADHPDNPIALLDAALVLVEFGEEEDGIAALERTAQLKRDDLRPVLPLISLLLQRKDPERLLQIWEPTLAALAGDDFRAGVAALMRGLGHFGYPDHARQLAERQRPRWSAAHVAMLDGLVANLDDSGDDTQDLGSLIEEFDRFSAYYDENLEAIGNRGPQLIGRMIEQLGWAPDASREILDAGCGTGLCAPYLRPFAKLLHGCDLSVGMLEKSKARNIFDLLTRTDLGNPATYPQASFTAVICADVLVYFGDLEPVLRNFAAIMRPGGWLILTVEDAAGQGQARGWERRPSGRYRHDPHYVVQALAKAGFSEPECEIRDTLRYEFRTPVAGYCVAAHVVPASSQH